MRTLWFVVPAAGRLELSRICLRQLRRTCDALADHRIAASAVVIADDENLDTARELGFATVERNNQFLSRKFNDGIQLACDPEHNPRPADFVVPCGSDDWIDHRILADLPPGRAYVHAFRLAAFVDETGTKISTREIDYKGGVGIRVYPAEMMRRVGYRPADEDRARGCDTSILVNLTRAHRTVAGAGPSIIYRDQHPFQIIDWKSRNEQLNAFSEIVGRFHRGTDQTDPFAALAGVYPDDALAEMRAHYGRDRELVAA